MTDLVSRGYAGERDYERLRVLLQGAYAEAGPDVAMTVGDLDYWRFQAADADAEMRSCRLWLDEHGAVVGFAWPGVVEDGAGVIDVFLHPCHRQVLEPVLEWAEHWHAQRRPGRSITTNAPEADEHMTAVLIRRGYRRTDEFRHWYRVRSLDHPVPVRAAVPGYTLRGADPTDAAALAEVNNRSGAGPALTAASVRALMAAPTYRPDLHVVVETRARSQIVAFCIVWYDEANAVGLLEPVACDPDRHRRGLGTAMLRESLRRLCDLGATHALVASAGTNAPANRLYESLGFQPHGRSWTWTKPGDPGVPPGRSDV